MSLAAGLRLGAYEIVSLLGAGGMGEVYRARDTRLKREVAIKILPDTFANDPERLARFHREAEVLASLNHPNIAQIHGIEDRALVLELVDGPTLADRIAREPIPVDEALPIAMQIAEALEAAHEHSIIHRDLKPANIKLTSDGVVKVLDFGLAKALENRDHSRAEASMSPTITTPAVTMGNVILGTAAYMSPEQAKGKPVDRRSDMWAFGCVLFEMLAGRRAFEGEDVSDTFAEVLRGEPKWNLLPANVPAAVMKLLRRCLAKDRKGRLADAATAALELDDAMRSPASVETSMPPAAPSRKRQSYVTWFAAVGLAAAIVVWGFIYQQPQPPPQQAYRFSILPPDNTRIGWAAGLGANRAVAAFALSPDGQYISFLGTDVEARTALWVRPLNSLAARALPGTEGANGQFWSPDSRSLAFFADGKLKKIDLNAAAPLTLCDAPATSTGTWGANGDILFGAFVPRGAIKRVASVGGSPTDVTRLSEKGTERHAWPVFLPDSEHFLYLSASGVGGPATLRPDGVYAASLSLPEPKRILEPGSNVQYANGHLLFLRERVIMAQRFDTRQLQLIGTAMPVAEGVAISEFVTFQGTFSVSPAGLLAYQSATGEQRAQLLWFDRDGKRLGEVGSIADISDPEISPDGKRIAVSVFDPAKRSRDVWLYDLKGTSNTKLTFDMAYSISPRWSLDSADVFFSSTQKGVRDFYRKSASGTGIETVFLADTNDKNLADISPDRKHIIVQHVDVGVGTRLFVRPASAEGKPVPLGFPKGNEYWGRFSPDGRWIAYYGDASGRREIWVTRFPLDGSRWQLTTTGAWYPRWRRDGREVFYLGFDNILYSLPVNGDGAAFQFGQAKPLFQFNPRMPFIPYDVSSDGQRFIVTNLREKPTEVPITVVVNWPAALDNPVTASK